METQKKIIIYAELNEESTTIKEYAQMIWEAVEKLPKGICDVLSVHVEDMNNNEIETIS
jgi:hypothetical protein